ncbi:hypothetical protein Lepto7375DRAFT_5335 [Leptolyngbya sp. PCC 7375]|nr:hypothetical protein Lepto7375DRAFT_5335 [Leptolyngbya sp. PCC 7375]
MLEELTNPIVLSDGEVEVIVDDIQAPAGEPAIDISGDQALLAVIPGGSIAAPDSGNTAVQASGDNATILNLGEIAGDLNGISSTGDSLRLLNIGTIQSNSRAVDISDGDGSFVLNTGDILGTGNQRNGTLYVDGTVDDLGLVNSGRIDAGEGNLGDAVSVQVGASDDPSNENINITNNGLLQGRGDGPDVFANGGRVAANGSSGLRFFNGSGEAEATVTGSVINRGTITSEVNVGFLGGLVVEDGVAFDGRIVNSGLISGPRNGLYIGNADHDLSIINTGAIESGSRVVNLDGDNVTLSNQGSIIGTGNQRNGTIYLDGTADDITVNNQGSVDAGEGNLGDAISVQVGATGDVVSEDINIVNSGLLQGRGDGPDVFANGGRVAANGSSGLRFFNGSGEAEATVTGSVVNRGTITSEVNVGFLGGLVVEDGVAFDGRIVNSGLISGPRNGLYIGNADHDLSIINTGAIESGSRVVNLDGDNVTLSNQGNIVGTGNQRNGTIYLDGTADDITVNNQGSVDAGEGNLGDAISVQVGATGDVVSEDINIVNSGLLQGRGDGPDVFANGGRVAANGSSGLRFFNGSGEAEATVTGSVVNRGTITSEVNVGFLGGLVVEDGVAFDGQINNSGLISGPRNGLYIGNADHDLSIVNSGQIESGSRAVNLDGDNVTLVNQGSILGTDIQRNGTVYLDGTADNISINNQLGTIDAGVAGSGISVQVGAANGLGDGIDDLELSADISNSGLIQGRGDSSVPAGIRLFVGSGLTEATFSGDITNELNGVIASEEQAGILIESGVIFDGQITNFGTISGGNGLAIDADGALGSVDILNAGTLNGEVRLGTGDDRFVQISTGDVVVSGGLGNDEIIGGTGNDSLNGGGDDDLLTGGLGSDTFRFESNAGNDVVTDFSVTDDSLNVEAIFDGFHDVLGAASQVGNDTLIDLGNDNSVLLAGVDVNSLTSNNFTFA